MKNRWAILVASGITMCATLALTARVARVQVQDSPRQLQQISPIKTWPSKAKRWALVIGVDKYSDPQISPLKGADNDARTLSDALVRYAGFPQDQVILLSTDQPTERQPTRINVLRRLSNLASVVPQDGLLLISFAGHGIERGGQAYLIPSDSQISDDINLLEESAVSVARMKDRIRATGVGQVVILLDACRNDPGGRADAPNPLTTAYVNAFNFDVRNHEVTAFATIYATAVGQRAYEYTEKKQGYFTWAIVEGLKGAAANDKGEVTLASLIKYVQEAVPKRVAIDLGGSKQQRPFSQMEGYKADELIIAVTANANASVPTSTSTNVDPAAFELSYWETIKNSTNASDFKSYLDKYPDGEFAALAKNRINNLATATKSDANNSGDNAAELAFWDAVKNSNRADDYRAYLTRYPNGIFADLAKSRVAPLAAEAETKRRTNNFSARYDWGAGPFPGKLFVTSSGIQFTSDNPKLKPKDWQCQSFSEAKVVGSALELQKSLKTKRAHSMEQQPTARQRPGGLESLVFESPEQAVEAFNAIKSYCSGELNSAPAVPNTSGATESKVDNSNRPTASKTLEFEVKNGQSRLAPKGTLYISASSVDFKVDKHPEKNRTFTCSEIKEVKQMKTVFGGYTSWVVIKAADGAHDFTARDTKDGTAIREAIGTTCGLR